MKSSKGCSFHFKRKDRSRIEDIRIYIEKLFEKCQIHIQLKCCFAENPYSCSIQIGFFHINIHSNTIFGKKLFIRIRVFVFEYERLRFPSQINCQSNVCSGAKKLLV